MATTVRNPKRVLARRDRNYRSVHRPTRWGNSYSAAEYGREKSIEMYRQWLKEKLREDPEFLEPLRGYNLGCTCSLDLPCHADVILEFLYA
jgi:hypothetical protein